MADESIDLRRLVCLVRHGVHFMDSRDSRSTGFQCKHCQLYNCDSQFFQNGISCWEHGAIRGYKNGVQVVDKQTGSYNKVEVQHALSLVGYRADAGE